MDIILLENIINLGKIGDKVSVKNGYGRNYLLRFNKALRFSKENLEYVNKKKDELNKKNNEQKQKFKLVSQKINNKSFTFSKESKENGDLYGQIKPKEIAREISEKMKLDIPPSQIIIKSEINKIGEYKISINLHSDVEAKVLIKVVKINTK